MQCRNKVDNAGNKVDSAGEAEIRRDRGEIRDGRERRSVMVSSPAIVENVLRGLLDAVAFIRNPANKAAVMKSLAKGLRLPRVEDTEQGYQSIVGIYEKKIYPSVGGIRNVIRLTGATNEKIRRLKAEELVDDSIVKKLEKAGAF